MAQSLVERLLKFDAYLLVDQTLGRREVLARMFEKVTLLLKWDSNFFLVYNVQDSTGKKGPCRTYNDFMYRRYSTPKKFWGQNFCVCLRGVSPTLCLHLKHF